MYCYNKKLLFNQVKIILNEYNIIRIKKYIINFVETQR